VIKMKQVKLLWLALAMMFIAVGCQKRESELSQQVDPVVVESLAKRSDQTESLRQAVYDGDTDMVQY